MEAGDLQQPLLTCVQSAPHTLRHDVDIAHDDLLLIPDLPVFVTKASSLLLLLLDLLQRRFHEFFSENPKLLLLCTIKKNTTTTTFIVFPKKQKQKKKIENIKLLKLLYS